MSKSGLRSISPSTRPRSSIFSRRTVDPFTRGFFGGTSASVVGVAGGRICSGGDGFGRGWAVVIAYSVSRRMREIGVRVPLGAPRSSVYKLVMRQAGWLTLAGDRTGLLGGNIAFNKEPVFGVRAWDAATLVAWPYCRGWRRCGQLPARASRGIGESHGYAASGIRV